MSQVLPPLWLPCSATPTDVLVWDRLHTPSRVYTLMLASQSVVWLSFTTSLSSATPERGHHKTRDIAGVPAKEMSRMCGICGWIRPSGVELSHLVRMNQVASHRGPDGAGHWLFNGEIYNYVELRDELRQRGHQFRTGTDTEVILAAYAQWGTDCFARFNGMWGLAIADLQRRVLILSRDRLGIKPLYVWAKNGAL